MISQGRGSGRWGSLKGSIADQSSVSGNLGRAFPIVPSRSAPTLRGGPEEGLISEWPVRFDFPSCYANASNGADRNSNFHNGGYCPHLGLGFDVPGGRHCALTMRNSV